ncbi:hypothetical protein J1G42_13390 [Cellulomonas sp. zg-ZUI222]|uniref:hypothetical protein n=1 Tax=Cellulomonas TaxID=1707 RepID=UPI001A9539BC|nr:MULTISPECIES: hypothetical protein [Cellulomonas]MBO0901372.1 hypothetical protein [Cellulomonas sp. zg-ZUI22]MBO0921818.1 hypothetical protein [Cellulomonas wangleii]
MDDMRDPGVPDDAAPDARGSGGTADTPGTAEAPGPAETSGPADLSDGADDAVARVRAADPAAGATPDAARLQARLAASTGVPLGPGGAAPVTDELAAARARRRPARWLQAAAVAAGVAVVGAGGYAIGAAGADEPGAPAIALQGGGAGATEMAADARMAGGWFGGRTVFTGSDLDGAGGSAQAWALDASQAATAQTAAQVAEVLGVPGEPRQEWGQWVVGASDGTSATVQVGIDGYASTWFYDPAHDPAACTVDPSSAPDDGASAEPAAPGSVGGSVGAAAGGAPDVSIQPAPDEQPAVVDPGVCDPAGTPTGDAAIERARDLMAELGVGPDGYEVAVTDETGVPGLVSVTGTQVVDGNQTGMAWSVQLAGDGVQSLYGTLAPLVPLGTYDVIGADEAVERLNDPRFGGSPGGVVPLAARAEGGVATLDEPATILPEPVEPTVPPVPAPGDPVAWPVQQVTLTGARLGVTVLTAPDGAVLVVPAWELTDADGGTWSVVAVVEDQLDLSPA